MQALGQAPLQGTLWPDLLPDLRWVIKNRAIFYFRVDERAAVLRVLAIFFGGQDHRMKCSFGSPIRIEHLDRPRPSSGTCGEEGLPSIQIAAGTT